MTLWKGHVFLVPLLIGFHTGLISVFSVNATTSFSVTSSSSASTYSPSASTFLPGSTPVPSFSESSPISPLSSSVALTEQTLFLSSTLQSGIEPSTSPFAPAASASSSPPWSAILPSIPLSSLTELTAQPPSQSSSPLSSSSEATVSSPFTTVTIVSDPYTSSSPFTPPSFATESTAPIQSPSPSTPSGLGNVVTSPALTSSSQTTSTPSLAPDTPGVVTTSSTIAQPAPPTGTRSPESSSSVWSTMQPVSSNATKPSVYIQVAFRIPWGRFCYLISLFKDALSKDLIEMNGFQHRLVSSKRIKLINAEKTCEDETKRNNDAIVEFYMSNSEEDLGVKDVSKDLTVYAYRVLYDYWVNKRMVLLDKTFENMVKKVKLEGDDAAWKSEGYTDGERVDIGIGVALGLIFLIVAIYLLLSWRRNVKQAQAKAKEGRIIIANRAAVDNNTSETVEPRDGSPSESNPENDIPVIRVHTPPELPRAQEPGPGPQTQKEEPEIIRDYETAQTEGEPAERGAPLAKPESDNVSEGEPIGETEESEAVTPPEEAEAATSEAQSPPDTARPDAATEDVDNETPASPDEKTKPDFDQAEDLNADHNQSAINLGFDEVEEPAREKTEETKF